MCTPSVPRRLLGTVAQLQRAGFLPFEISVHVLSDWIGSSSYTATIRGDGVRAGEVEDVYFGGGFADRGNPRSRYYYIRSFPDSTVPQYYHDFQSPRTIRVHYGHNKSGRCYDHGDPREYSRSIPDSRSSITITAVELRPSRPAYRPSLFERNSNWTLIA